MWLKVVGQVIFFSFRFLSRYIFLWICYLIVITVKLPLKSQEAVLRTILKWSWNDLCATIKKFKKTNWSLSLQNWIFIWCDRGKSGVSTNWVKIISEIASMYFFFHIEIGNIWWKCRNMKLIMILHEIFTLKFTFILDYFIQESTIQWIAAK